MSSKLRGIATPTLVSIIGALIALFPSNPNNMPLPSRDSGVFLYVGWRFISGDIPYRDVWDHKPPLIYFVDALGLTLTPSSLWGVWLLQFLFIALTIFVIYKVLQREFGIMAGMAGAVIFVSGLLTILDRGNVTEEYALLFQALCFWIFIRAQEKNYPLRDTFWIGLCGGLAFNFKQTTVGILAAYGLILILSKLLQRKWPIRDILYLAGGWIIPSLGVALYFASQNAIADFWGQAFAYNFVYIGKHEGIRRLIPVFIKGFAYLRQGWVLYLPIIGWMMGLIFIWIRRKNLLDKVNSLILLALIDLPVEVLLITVSGRSILHYYLTPLPVMAILTGILVYTTPFLIEKILPKLPLKTNVISSVLLAMILLFQIQKISDYPNQVESMQKNSRAPTIEYVIKHTKENDKVLIIGAESVVNFLSRREAPTRYVYQYPLALLGSRPMFEEYFNQILADKPTLIIDTRGREGLAEKLYTPLQKRSEIVKNGVKTLGENYEQVAKFGDWRIYRLIEKP